MSYQVDHKVGPSKMKAKNGDQKILFVRIIDLTDDFLMQQKVNRSIPSCDDLIASKGHNHKMLLAFPMALNPFATMQEKGFSMSHPVVINAKLNLLIFFHLQPLMWFQMKVVFPSCNTHLNQAFGVHLIGPIDEGSSFNSEHSDKSSSWSAFNWPIDEGSSFNSKHFDKSSSWSAFNWPIDEGSSFNSEHSNKSSSWSAFNWPIDEGSSFNLKHYDKSSS
jgi:hypothetical protein